MVCSRNSGKSNPFYGKKHTEEAKRKMSINKKGLYSGIKNPFYGKKHTQESKDKIGKANQRTEIQKRELAFAKFKIIIPKEELYDLYHIKKLSFIKIAKIFGVKGTTISRLYKFYGLKSRSLSDAGKARYRMIKKGTIDKDGYKLIWMNGKKIREHRYVWEQKHGSISKGYDIHHINRIRDDNRIENLALYTHSEHAKLRRKGR